MVLSECVLGWYGNLVLLILSACPNYTNTVETVMSIVDTLNQPYYIFLQNYYVILRNTLLMVSVYEICTNLLSRATYSTYRDIPPEASRVKCFAQGHNIFLQRLRIEPATF